MEEFDEIFHIVSIKDDKAKILAMELANDKGRKVLDAIFENKKSSSDLAKELNLGLPTILFHIERLKETGQYSSCPQTRRTYLTGPPITSEHASPLK